MKLYAEIKEACLVGTVSLGAAFMSGREASTFFAVTGAASWTGVLAAAVIFGLMCGMLCRFAWDTGARSLPGIYYAKMDARCGEAAAVVHFLLMLMMGAVALTTAGELGLLSLSMPHPQAAAMISTLLLAVMLTLRKNIRGSMPGMVFVSVCLVFFCALALDKRPAAAGAYLKSSALDVSGSIPVAIFMGAMFAFLKAAISGGVIVQRCSGLVPLRFGICCGVVTALTTGCANWALQAAGPEVWALNLPFVVLAARWGVVGYYISVYVMWLGCLAMLSAALTAMSAVYPGWFGRTFAVILSAAAAALMSLTGLRTLTGAAYPLLGWVCAVFLGALGVFYERQKPLPGRSFPINKQVL